MNNSNTLQSNTDLRDSSISLSKPKTRIFLDASAIKESACIKRLYYTVVRGLSFPSDFVMNYGTAGHLFIAKWLSNGKDFESALLPALEHYSKFTVPAGDRRTASHLIETLEKYSTLYSYDNFELASIDNKPLVEQKFAWPFRVTERFEFVIAGTIDKIGVFEGQMCIGDNKFTSVWSPEKYLESFALSPQLRMYKLILIKLAAAFPKSFGAFEDVGAFIDGIFTPKKGTTFQRSRIFNFTREDMEEFEALLNALIDRLIVALDSNHFPLEGRFNNSCDNNGGVEAFGPCKYAQLCGLPDERSKEDLIPIVYHVKEYNPLKFGME